MDPTTSAGRGPSATIAPGVDMPLLGLGTYLLDDGGPCARAVAAALEAGDRKIDTASMYGNERDVGRAVRGSGLARGDVFVTTKLWNSDQGRDTTRGALESSLGRLGLDHVDLYLVHWPQAGRWEASWEVMQELHADGLARAIGVSNFLVPHLDRLAALGGAPPAVNQIELHPFVFTARRDVVARCRRDGITVEAYSPLTRGRRFDHPAVRDVARRTGASPAQVLIRWGIEHGFATVPKSGDPARIRENLGALGIPFDARDRATLDAVGGHLVVSWDPDDAL